MSKKFRIEWNKKPPTDVAGKLEKYEVRLSQNYGLLADKKDDYAIVDTHFSYRVVRKRYEN